jgi:hypothetical protein
LRPGLKPAPTEMDISTPFPGSFPGAPTFSNLTISSRPSPFTSANSVANQLPLPATDGEPVAANPAPFDRPTKTSCFSYARAVPGSATSEIRATAMKATRPCPPEGVTLDRCLLLTMAYSSLTVVLVSDL